MRTVHCRHYQPQEVTGKKPHVAVAAETRVRTHQERMDRVKLGIETWRPTQQLSNACRHAGREKVIALAEAAKGTAALSGNYIAQARARALHNGIAEGSWGMGPAHIGTP